MRKLILLFLFVSSSLWLHAKDFTQYVSPLVGTQSTFELSTGNTCLLYTSPSPRDCS